MKETNTSSDDSYDAIIVGSGIAGSVIANMLAKKLKKILIIEKMHHIGGSTYEETLPNGMRIQKYGPHIFHTDSEEVYNYIIQFGQWYNYRHSVLGNIDGKLVPVPFNFKSIDVLYDKCKACEIKNKLSEYFPKSNCVSISEISNHEDATIKEFGDYIYEKVIKNYTKKQWDNEPKEIDPSIINRVKITLGYNDCYFKDKYQFMPQNGYNDIFKNLLDSPNITVMLGSEARDVIRLHRNKVYFNNLPFDCMHKRPVPCRC